MTYSDTHSDRIFECYIGGDLEKVKSILSIVPLSATKPIGPVVAV